MTDHIDTLRAFELCDADLQAARDRITELEAENERLRGALSEDSAKQALKAFNALNHVLREPYDHRDGELSMGLQREVAAYLEQQFNAATTLNKETEGSA